MYHLGADRQLGEDREERADVLVLQVRQIVEYLR